MNEIPNLPAVPEIKLPEGPKLEGFFRSDDEVETMIVQIEGAVRAHVPDLTSKKGRDAIASLAYNVSKSKTFLDGEGKKLVDGIKKQAEGIDKARKKIRDRMDALRDEARKPLTEWEAAEEERQARDKDIVRRITSHGLTGFEATAEIIAKGHEIKGITLPDDFGGDREALEAVRSATMQALRNMFDTAKKREDDAAELARLRVEQEERAAKEAEEKAALEAAERAAQQERDRAEAAEQARKEADERAASEIERAKREAAEAVDRAQREAQEQIERERQAAADREAARMQAEEQARIEAAEIAAQQKAEADRLAESETRRKQVREDIEAALQEMSGRATPAAIAEALIAGDIPHCKVLL